MPTSSAKNRSAARASAPKRAPARPRSGGQVAAAALLPRAARAQPAGIDPRFAKRLIAWQRSHGRHDLPWQRRRDAYRIWLAEIMLQQTQVETVIPYYLRFLARFPDLASLARAGTDAVMREWAGLGYYARARNLHRTARDIIGHHAGRFPQSRQALEQLAGIGRSTAAAIAVFAHGAREAILDGNVRRVLARHFALPGDPAGTRVQRRLWALAEALLPCRSVDRYTQALMDLGATVCTRAAPCCERCPVRASCRALALDRVGEFPPPRSRAPRPLRKVSVLVLVHQGRVLLERRAPRGIWGGLWSLPELPGRPARREIADDCARRYGVELAGIAPLAAVRHEFTHFSLDICALRCDVAAAGTLARKASVRWFAIDSALGQALPAPVKRLLREARQGATREAMEGSRRRR